MDAGWIKQNMFSFQPQGNQQPQWICHICNSQNIVLSSNIRDTKIYYPFQTFSNFTYFLDDPTAFMKQNKESVIHYLRTLSDRCLAHRDCISHIFKVPTAGRHLSHTLVISKASGLGFQAICYFLCSCQSEGTQPTLMKGSQKIFPVQRHIFPTSPLKGFFLPIFMLLYIS